MCCTLQRPCFYSVHISYNIIVILDVTHTNHLTWECIYTYKSPYMQMHLHIQITIHGNPSTHANAQKTIRKMWQLSLRRLFVVAAAQRHVRAAGLVVGEPHAECRQRRTTTLLPLAPHRRKSNRGCYRRRCCCCCCYPAPSGLQTGATGGFTPPTGGSPPSPNFSLDIQSTN